MAKEALERELGETARRGRRLSRYSQLYIERGRPQADSKRARIRLHGLFDRHVDDTFEGEVAELIRTEIGIKVFHFRDFFSEAEIRDVLDSVTAVAAVLSRYTGTRNARPDQWLAGANRIFEEENLAYRIGPDAIVHPFVDQEFQANRASALEALSDPRFGEARSDFEAAYRHLRDGNGKEALRMMFPAVEVAAKVLFPGTLSRLMPNEVDRHIVPRMRARYAGNQPAIDAGHQLLGGMKNWISAAQPYRHGQEQQGPAEPPMDFVIAHLSAGATYLRWMIELCSE